MTFAPSKEHFERAAMQYLDELLALETREIERTVSDLLRRVDLYWKGIEDDQVSSVKAAVEAYEAVLRGHGMSVAPPLAEQFEYARAIGREARVTLTLADDAYGLLGEKLGAAVLSLTSWRVGRPAETVVPADDTDVGEAIRQAAIGLCLMALDGGRLRDDEREKTHHLLRYLAPGLQPARLADLAACVEAASCGEEFELARRPGFTGDGRLGVLALWPDPQERGQRWVVAADASWVVLTPCRDDTAPAAQALVAQTSLRWERAELPDHGVGLVGALVEFAIESAARRAQVLSRSIDKLLTSATQDVQAGLREITEDLLDLATHLDDLEVAVDDARSDLARYPPREATPRAAADEHVRTDLERDRARALSIVLNDAFDKLERHHQRLHTGFLAAREAAAAETIAATMEKIDNQQEDTRRLTHAVSVLTIALIGPTIVFGALGVDGTWVARSSGVLQWLALLAYMIIGATVSWAAYRLTRRSLRPRDASDH